MLDLKITLKKGLRIVVLFLLAVLITSLPVIAPHVANLRVVDVIYSILANISQNLPELTVLAFLEMLRNYLKHRNP